jgi:hypothetical protein
MKKMFIMLIFCVVFIPNTYASMIARIDLDELIAKSEYVVLGKVIDVSSKDVRDIVTVKVASSLKGNLAREEVSFMLTTRGGIKNFDPQLKIGDTGVFFLIEKNGEIKRSYWGSIAIFNRNNFD